MLFDDLYCVLNANVPCSFAQSVCIFFDNRSAEGHHCQMMWAEGGLNFEYLLKKRE